MLRICKKPNKYLNNFNNTIKLIKICEKFGLEKIIFSSTAAVYGNSRTGTCSERSKLNPLSMYIFQSLNVKIFKKKKI